MKKLSRIISVFLVAVLAVSSVALGTVNAGAVSKIKKNKGNFYLQLNKTLNYSGYNFKYKIYAFNVNSKSAKAANKRIYNYFKKFYTDDYTAYVNGYSLDHTVTGSTYTNGNILSIRQKATASSWWEYKAYNINKKTGRRLTAENLYTKYGYTKKSFNKALKKQQVSRIKKMLSKSPGLKPYASEMLSYARSSESRKGMQVYLDGKGKLCAVAKLNTFVAAGIYQYVFKLSKK